MRFYILCLIVLGTIFFVGTRLSKIHQLPNGRVADTFHNFSILNFLNRRCTFKTQISPVKADKLSKETERFRENVNKAGLIDVAVAVVCDAIFLTLFGGVLINDLVVNRLARLLVDIAILGLEFEGMVGVIP